MEIQLKDGLSSMAEDIECRRSVGYSERALGKMLNVATLSMQEVFQWKETHSRKAFKQLR